jgi:hypothetical protein
LSTKVNRLDSQQPQNSDLLNWCQIFILHFELPAHASLVRDTDLPGLEKNP